MLVYFLSFDIISIAVEYQIAPLSDQSISISLGNTITPDNTRRLSAMKNWLIDASLPGVLDIIIAYSSLTISYDYFQVYQSNPLQSPLLFFETKLRRAYKEATITQATSNHWRIPVCYNEKMGPDLLAVAREKNISPESLIEIHTSKDYTVFMIGFLPGFPYLAEVDSRIEIGRKKTPRAKVEAGSVGLAGKQTGIYSLSSPGGWQIIGRTPFPLFDATAEKPVQIEISDTVRFFQITEEQFYNFSKTR